MATEERQPPGSASGPTQGPPGGRRRPPIIELEATEVTGDTVPPPNLGRSMGDRLRDAVAAHGRPIGIGAGGAVAGALVVLLLWLVLAPRNGPDPTAALAPRFAAIETQLRELAARPQPAAIDTRALDELTARLAKLEAAVAAPRPAATADAAMLGRVAAADEALKSLTETVGQLTKRIDAIAATLTELQTAARASGADRGEVAALGGKIAALEQSNQAIRDELAKRVVAAASDQATRRAMLASALRGAVERGEPFAAELAAVKSLTTDAAMLAALEPLAAAGLPSSASLGRELGALVEPMRRLAASASGESGILDRLQANAQKLVRVRRVEEVTGDAPAAALTRIEQKAAQGDIGGALAELGALPSAVRAPAQGWIAKAQARQAAVAAANRLAADALAALKTTP